MLQDLRLKLAQAKKTFSEAWLACAFMMVQGDLTAFTLNHAFIAASTGVYAALAILLTLHIYPKSGKFFIAWMTGLVTMLADKLTHPTHFGDAWSEALMTGIGAMCLAFLFDAIGKARKADD